MLQLEAALEEATSGRGQLLMVVGEPGIGKTRLLDEISARARAGGAVVVFARCWEGGSAPAFWPWVQVLRAYVAAGGVEESARKLGHGATRIAELVPELRGRLGDTLELPGPWSIDPESARFALFDSVAEFLKSTTASRPLVLVLDDLHAADPPSLLLLHFLAGEPRDARILVIGSYRDVEFRRQARVPELLAALARQGRPMLLRGLGEIDVGRFIEEAAGVAPAPSLVAAIHQVTDGNPFFVDEVVRLLAAEGRLAATGPFESGWLRIPVGIREAIRRRLAPLSLECREVLNVGSVAGREFDLACVQHACAVPPDRVLEAVGEAISAGIVIEVSGSFARYTFSHQLIRDCICDELSPTRRVWLHRTIGESLEWLYRNDLEAHLAELAHHFFAAALGGDVRKAVDYATRAGDRALRLSAFEDAAAHYERALEATKLAEANKTTAANYYCPSGPRWMEQVIPRRRRAHSSRQH